MDIPAVQAISLDLQRSAQQLNDSARRLSDVVRGFTAGQAGRDYGSRGERVATGLDGLCNRMFTWVNCINDTGVAFGQVATTNREVDLGSATAISSAGSVTV
ncbi:MULTISPECIES: hypothetical protein [Nocardia]|uniref:ESX-1 secretion-associated protein n=1 Tax=Nocardia elegans TaxID=300029 RepID=A0ABW6T749_9NOCA|nr:MULTISPECIES: hypothetical protein [Nocardia]MBF6242224.1 hypothetical protein [Nocardia elegans]MBF6446945.1 hypothetical protein [Nocardia elegans]